MSSKWINALPLFLLPFMLQAGTPNVGPINSSSVAERGGGGMREGGREEGMQGMHREGNMHYNNYHPNESYHSNEYNRNNEMNREYDPTRNVYRGGGNEWNQHPNENWNRYGGEHPNENWANPNLNNQGVPIQPVVPLYDNSMTPLTQPQPVYQNTQPNYPPPTNYQSQPQGYPQGYNPSQAQPSTQPTTPTMQPTTPTTQPTPSITPAPQ